VHVEEEQENVTGCKQEHGHAAELRLSRRMRKRSRARKELKCNKYSP
jgi:hypothetical protein